jgi:hypothetical protein
MRIPIGLLLISSGIIGLTPQSGFAQPQPAPQYAYYCPVVPQRPGEPQRLRPYDRTCCPILVEERQVYDTATRRYRTVTFETQEQCTASGFFIPQGGSGSSETIVVGQTPHVVTPPPVPGGGGGGSELETRPGWGYGDDNHIHTGPPGQTGDSPGRGPDGNGPPGHNK